MDVVLVLPIYDSVVTDISWQYSTWDQKKKKTPKIQRESFLSDITNFN